MIEGDRGLISKCYQKNSIENKPLGMPVHRWGRNIRTYIKEIDINTRNLFDSAQDNDF